MPARVFTNGIELIAEPLFSLEKFFRSLTGAGAISRPGIRSRVLEVKVEGDCVIGVLFSDTNHSSYILIEVVDGRTQVQIEDTPDGRNRYDFTFFRINFATGRGLFSQYRGSGGATAFKNFLGGLYKEQIGQQIGRLSDELDERQLKRLKRAKLEGSYLAPDHDFVEELEKLAKIHHFEFTEPRVNDPRFQPLSRSLAMSHHRIHFQREPNFFASIKDFISQFVPERHQHRKSRRKRPSRQRAGSPN